MKRVLLAEDNAHMRELIGDYLEENGFEVEAAADGLAAWEMFQTGNYQLILLDVMMPEMDGFTLCRNIREKENVPILFLTARVQEEDQLRGVPAGGGRLYPEALFSSGAGGKMPGHSGTERGRRMVGIGRDPAESPAEAGAVRRGAGGAAESGF